MSPCPLTKTFPRPFTSPVLTAYEGAGPEGWPELLDAWVVGVEVAEVEPAVECELVEGPDVVLEDEVPEEEQPAASPTVVKASTSPSGLTKVLVPRCNFRRDLPDAVSPSMVQFANRVPPFDCCKQHQSWWLMTA